MTNFLAPYNIVVVRETRNVANPAVVDITTVYSGPGDVQYGIGTLSYGPQGAIVQYDAVGIFYPSSGVLPDIQVSDKLTVNGVEMLVMDANTFPAPLAHLEIRLRRGDLSYAGGPK